MMRIEGCDQCDDKLDENYSSVMNGSSGDMEVLCTDCYDNKMCMACRSCDITHWGKYLEFDPENELENPLCEDCYDKKEASQ